MLLENAPRSGFISHEQYETLRQELPEPLRLVLTIAFHTGMRRGEVLRLDWTVVDFIANTIRLRAGETKNDQGRVIPLSAELRTALAEAYSKRGECPLVCSRREHGIGSFRKAWASATKRAGLAGLFFHDLRRSAVRNLVRSGVPEGIAMQISGHRTRSVFDRYNIVSENDLMDGAHKLDEYHAEARRQASENGHNSGTLLRKNVASGRMN